MLNISVDIKLWQECKLFTELKSRYNPQQKSVKLTISMKFNENWYIIYDIIYILIRRVDHKIANFTLAPPENRHMQFESFKCYTPNKIVLIP